MTFIIGICSGKRAIGACIALLAKHGIIVEIESDRSLSPKVRLVDKKKSKLGHDLANIKLSVLFCGSRDLPHLLANGMIHMAVGFDLEYKLDNNYRFRIVDSDKDPKTLARISLVCKKGKEKGIVNGRYHKRIISEFPSRVVKQSNLIKYLEPREYTIMNTTSASEGMIDRPELGENSFNVGCVVVQSGETLVQNDLVEFETIAQIYPSIYINSGKHWGDKLTAVLFNHFDIPIVVEGIDGSGKTTLVEKLKKAGFEAYDRGELSEMTLQSQYLWSGKNLRTAIYIILDIDETLATERVLKRDGELDKWAQPTAQMFYRKKYRALAAKYGFYFIDVTTLTKEQVFDIVTTRLDDYMMPRVDHMDDDLFESLPILNEGDSKTIRIITGKTPVGSEHDGKYCVVKYKPSVYSNRQNRPGNIDGSDKIRMRMFRSMLELLWVKGHSHSAVYVGDRYLLTEYIPNENIPKIEVLVKRYLVGSDKYLYHDLSAEKSLFDGSFHGYIKYKTPYVKYTWRNPNFVRKNDDSEPLKMKDEVIADGLVAQMMDVNKCSSYALRVTEDINDFFNYCNLELLDICLMMTRDGKYMYYEISPDNCRYRRIDNGESYDKDNWRFGCSEEKVKTAWREGAMMIEEKMSTYIDGCLNI